MKLPINYDEAHFTVRKQAREQYIQKQDGLCYHCGCYLEGDPAEEIKTKPVTKSLFPENFFDWPVHLHHSHDTGMTIGAVHSYCNAVLWEYHGR